MKMLKALIILVCFVSISAVAQSVSKDLSSAQKDFEKALIKNTKNIYDVDFSGCEVSIKVVTRFSSSFSPIASPPPQGSAGFPTDTFGQTYGMDPVVPERSVRYLLNLAGLDENKIGVTRSVRKNTSVILLTKGKDADAIRKKDGKKITTVDSFFIVTSAKSAAKTAAAARKLIAQCSAQGLSR